MIAPIVPPVPGRPDPPLVGRERERAALREALAAALTGRGGLVLIGGEAGIGKTTLAEQAAREAADRGALVLIGRCYDLAETPPYGPWAELFGGYAPADSGPPPPAPFAERGMVGQVASQALLFRQVLDCFAALAERQPVVLLLDDVHWADQESLGLLRFLARSLAALPLLLLATYRADELTRRHPLYQLLPALVREGGAARLDLPRLDDAAVRSLLATHYGLAAADETLLACYLQERAEGNGLFLSEILRTLEEQRTLRRDGAHWHLGDLRHTGVPTLLRQVIDGRLARLGEESQRLLAVAAVIGHAVPLDLWGGVAEADEETLARATEEAIAAHLLATSGGDVRFGHALLREALYEGLAPPRRRILHRRAGEFLAASLRPDPDAVAHHFQQAGDPRAAAWLIAAGERAQAAYARLTAADRFEAALALLEAQGAGAGERGWLLLRLGLLIRFADARKALAYLEGAERLAVETGDGLLGASSRFNVGQVLSYLDDPRGAITAMDEAVAALAALPQVDEATRRHVAAMGIAADVRHHRGTLALNLAHDGEVNRALPLAEVVARDIPEPPWPTLDGALATDAHAALGIAYALRGRPDAALAAWERAIAACRAIGDPGLVIWYIAAALWWAAVPYRADDPAGLRRLRREMADARRSASAATPDLLRLHMGDIAVLALDGGWAEALGLLAAMRTQPGGRLSALDIASFWGPLVLAREGAAAARRLVAAALPEGPGTRRGEHFFLWVALTMRLGAAVALELGELPAAKEWMGAHERWLAGAGGVLWQSEGQALWAQYHRQAGDREAAQAHAQRALALATEPRQPLALLAAHRLLGELATEARQYDAAARALDASLAIAVACDAPYERALTLLALADLRAATGDRDGVLATLAEARALLAPLGAQPALARADALDARLAAPAAAPAGPALPAGLTAREAEVLRLVARGLSNAAVAAELFLSPRTVNTHLTSVYGKLGVEGRPAAIRFALDHGLR